MSLFTVDRSKCKKDGICAAVCPLRIITMGEDGLPATPDGASCINCGHCVSVCPQGAATLKTMNPADLVAVQDRLIPGPEQVAHFLAARRSIRSYIDRPVDRETLERLIGIAGFAPSGHNAQPVHWLVVEDAGEVRRLSGLVIDWMRQMIKERPEVAGPMGMRALVAAWEMGLDNISRRAPHVVLAHGPKKLGVTRDSCIIALTYLELAAYSMGLGACWAGYLGTAAAVFPPLIEALGIPGEHRVFGAMMLGYPRFKYQRIPRRKEPSVSWR